MNQPCKVTMKMQENPTKYKIKNFDDILLNWKVGK